MSLGIIYAIISMVGFGLANTVSKIAIKDIGAKQTIFWRNLITSLGFLIVFLLFSSQYQLTLIYFIVAILIGVLGFIPFYLFYKAQNIGKLGIINPIANSYMLFTVIFSVIFFGENLTLIQIFSIIVILIGLILISINFNDIKNSELIDMKKGIPLAFISCLLWGLTFTLFKIPVNLIGPILTSLIVDFIGFLLVMSLLYSRKEKFVKPTKSTLFSLFIVGIGGFLGLLFFNLGIKISNVSLISAISSTNPIIAVIFGGIYYNEKLRKLQYLGILIVLIGIILITL